MKLFHGNSLVLRALYVAVSFAAATSIPFADANSDSRVFDFVNLGSRSDPNKRYHIDYRAIHLSRKVQGGIYLNEFNVGHSIERIGSDAKHFWREELGRPPGTRYIEKFRWDDFNLFAYPTVISESRDIQGVANTFPCATSDHRGCDYVSAAGQRWIFNATLTKAQGHHLHHAIAQWESATDGVGSAHIYFRDGLEKFRVQYPGMAGQLWFRNEWGRNLQMTYADHVNTANTIGWSDPEVYRHTDIKLDPAETVVLRQYSGCREKYRPELPAHLNCEVFEDHIYAKDKFGNPMGQVGFIAGFTPAHSDWYKLGNYWAVNHVMIFIERVG